LIWYLIVSFDHKWSGASQEFTLNAADKSVAVIRERQSQALACMNALLLRALAASSSC